MRSTEQAVGLDFRITLLFSCSNIGQIGSLSLSNVCLQQQNVCHDKQNKNVCRDKHTFVATKRQTRVCNDKTRLLSRQKLACRDKHFFFFFSVATNICRDKLTSIGGKHTFVATKDVFCRYKHVFVVLSRQK